MKKGFRKSSTDYAGFNVGIGLSVTQVRVYYNHKELATHERVYGKNTWGLNAWHYVELISRRPKAFDSARPLKQWRKDWPASLEAFLARFCQSQGCSRGIKDFITVLFLYRDYPAADVEAAVEAALESQLSCSAGVKHLLQHSQAEPSFESLAQWPCLPAADVSVYDQLQSGEFPAAGTGGEL